MLSKDKKLYGYLLFIIISNIKLNSLKKYKIYIYIIDEYTLYIFK